jgi:hypothetical protein
MHLTTTRWKKQAALLAVALLAAAALLVSCRSEPLIVYVVLSPTPGGDSVADVPTNTPEATPAVQAATPDVAQPTAETTVPAETQPAGTAAPSTPAQTPTPATPVAGVTLTPVAIDIQVAEQLFEGGRMFWLQPTNQIWVAVVTGEGRGTWSVYPDIWTEGDPVDDPSLTPPPDREQPVRGFGLLWRENDQVRNALGWAIAREFGYVSRYEYHAGGVIDAAGTRQPAPGYYILFSFAGEEFRFNEDGTWQLGG